MMEWTTAWTVATREAQRWNVKQVVWLRPVSQMRGLLRPAKRIARAMLAKERTPVRLVTYVEISDFESLNQALDVWGKTDL